MLSKQFKDILIDEMRLAAKNMQETSDPLQKLYYFTSVHGMANRVLNIEYEQKLIFAHQVFKVAYDTLNHRIQLIISGQDRTIEPPLEALDRLINDILILAEAIEKDDDSAFYKTLEDISIISYLFTGNGYYLYKKDIIQI